MARILRDVRREGDDALVRLTARFDGVRARVRADLRVTPSELRALGAPAPTGRSWPRCARMAERIEAFHRAPAATAASACDLPDGSRARGGRDGRSTRPALYVPGGAGAYPSSVLMNAIPARVAGVPRVQVVTPPRALEANPGAGRGAA